MVFGFISAPLSTIILTNWLEELAEQWRGVRPRSDLKGERGREREMERERESVYSYRHRMSVLSCSVSFLTNLHDIHLCSLLQEQASNVHVSMATCNVKRRVLVMPHPLHTVGILIDHLANYPEDKHTHGDHMHTHNNTHH